MSRVFTILMCCLLVASIFISGLGRNAVAGNKKVTQAPEMKDSLHDSKYIESFHTGNAVNSDYPRDTIFEASETSAVFPGGDKALMQYIRGSSIYPVELYGSGISGGVAVRFVLLPDCSVKDVEIIRSLHPLIDEDALRVIEAMPKWESPGMVNGVPVRMHCIVPAYYEDPGLPEQQETHKP